MGDSPGMSVRQILSPVSSRNRGMQREEIDREGKEKDHPFDDEAQSFDVHPDSPFRMRSASLIPER